MASSIKIQINLQASLVSTGGTKQYTPNASITETVAGKYAVQNTITVPTSDTTLDKGSIGTVGVVMVQNLDDTNYVQVGDGTNWLVRLEPNGEPFVGRWDTGTPHVKAHTGACDVYYFICEA